MTKPYPRIWNWEENRTTGPIQILGEFTYNMWRNLCTCYLGIQTILSTVFTFYFKPNCQPQTHWLAFSLRDNITFKSLEGHYTPHCSWISEMFQSNSWWGQSWRCHEMRRVEHWQRRLGPNVLKFEVLMQLHSWFLGYIIPCEIPWTLNVLVLRDWLSPYLQGFSLKSKFTPRVCWCSLLVALLMFLTMWAVICNVL